MWHEVVWHVLLWRGHILTEFTELSEFSAGNFVNSVNSVSNRIRACGEYLTVSGNLVVILIGRCRRVRKLCRRVSL
jgi:hypothetical protein